MQIHITKEYDGMPLRLFLRAELKLSSKMIKHLKFCENGILINQKHVTVRYLLSAGDLLELATEDEESAPIAPVSCAGSSELRRKRALPAHSGASSASSLRRSDQKFLPSPEPEWNWRRFTPESSISRCPEDRRRCASATISSTGREREGPRVSGMMQ